MAVTQLLFLAISMVDVAELHSLATEEDVADVINLYIEFFTEDPSNTEEVALHSQNPNLGLTFGQPLDGADPGVEVESSMSPEVLSKNLGFVNGTPILFNSHRHRNGLNAWNTDEPPTAESNEEMVPFSLRWHQIAGVHAIIRTNFTPEAEPGRCCGMLIADEVGLGKTFQAVTTIAFLSDLIIRAERNAPIPPIIGTYTCLILFIQSTNLMPP